MMLGIHKKFCFGPQDLAKQEDMRGKGGTKTSIKFVWIAMRVDLIILC